MFEFQIETNSIIKQSEITDNKLKSKIPEWAIYFEWIVSDWELNRNGYKIDPTAWFINKKYVKDFLKTWSILYNHNSDQPIGSPLSMELIDWKVYVSGYVFDDTATNGAIGRWLIKWLSTWHQTHDYVFENQKTWKRLTQDEFYWLEFEEVQNNNWIIVVTNAEIIEFSFVTVRSNRASVLINHIDDIAQKFKKTTKEVENLFYLNNSIEIMEKEEVKTEVKTVVTEDKKEDNSKINELNSKVESLQNSFEEFKKSLKEEMEMNFTKKLNEAIETETNKLRTEAKANLVEIVKKENNESNWVKSMEEFKNKYFNK